MSNAKDLRKQIRNVLQETSKDILASEMGAQVKKEVTDLMNSRIDRIESYCQESLMKADKRARSIEGFLMRVVKTEIQNDLYNANLTIDSVVAVLAESGVVIEDFSAKVDAKKLSLDKARKEAASAAMQAEMEKRAAEGKPQGEDVVGATPPAPAPEAPAPEAQAPAAPTAE